MHLLMHVNAGYSKLEIVTGKSSIEKLCAVETNCLVFDNNKVKCATR